MSREFAKASYNSSAWRNAKKSYIKSVYGLCKRCERPWYIAHHKKALIHNNFNDYNITLNHDNLEYLCLDCHNAQHDFNREKKSGTKKGYKFNDKGELVPST